MPNNIPTASLEDYPERDFYNAPVGSNAAAGAVQAKTTAASGFYLDLIYESGRGKINFVSGAPDDDGIIIGTSVTLRAEEKEGYKFSYWKRKGYDEFYNATLALNSINVNYIELRAVFEPYVTGSSDGPNSGNTPGTLRYALNNAKDGDTVWFGNVTKITLNSPLSIYNKSITIEGNGLTLSGAWKEAGEDTSLLNIDAFSYSKNITINRVHFTGGAAIQGGAIHSSYTNLTLESCIFSNNAGKYSQYAYPSDGGGAIFFIGYSDTQLFVRGCTFYNNTAVTNGGAIYLRYGSIELTGNLFYANTSSNDWNILYSDSVYNTKTCSYNAVDVNFGTANSTTQCGWVQGTGDRTFSELNCGNNPFNTDTFAPNQNLRNIVPLNLTSPFPATDFNGDDRDWPGAVK